MDLTYFLHMWNNLGLLAFSLVLASFAQFILTWSRCAHAALHHAALAAAAAAVNADDTQPVSAVDEDDVCAPELVKLRMLAAFAIPVVYLYALYYLRSVDTFAFYVRMLKEIIKDFTPFLVIFIWFLLSVTAGFWSLKCSSSQITQDDPRHAFASVLFAVSLIPFEMGVPQELEECFADHSLTSTTAHILLWYLIFMLPLLSLNALIAIMGSTYNNVQQRHRQQQYKEWAQIIGDVVRQWPDKKRVEWEKQFHWIHTLKPRKPDGVRARELHNSRLHTPMIHEVTPHDVSPHDTSHGLDVTEHVLLHSDPVLKCQWQSEGKGLQQGLQQGPQQGLQLFDRLAKLDVTLTAMTQMLADVVEHQSASHCNTLQHTATHCDTLQRHVAEHGSACTPPLSSRHASVKQAPGARLDSPTSRSSSFSAAQEACAADCVFAR